MGSAHESLCNQQGSMLITRGGAIYIDDDYVLTRAVKRGGIFVSLIVVNLDSKGNFFFSPLFPPSKD